ncbi:sigma-54 dependent transcriptional regulator [Pseudoalteromonas sp. CNC9-20]|uniref:sigma-54-dependent transcriptional regulator n=1 Tax=Pseudoalteromonas sp. CNC9-20 TaxID=2917750 RepID=UPI001EF726F7|nr:sigma-54 dependent transcriptional regulator [Pseudoalteromonas sp. CNC9-20]MCG7569091.1 sigma-54 dependent transcriptional regulator [Pseudoalteromonas sp. CNC9-20]
MARILIIDDQSDVRLSARIALESDNHHCIEADSPTAALSQLNRHQVDLVLLDMNFTKDTTSGKEGLAFLDSLRQCSRRIAVVVITAYANVELAVKAMQLGACDFVEKPWQNRRLVNAVRKHLPHDNSEANDRFLAFSKKTQTLIENAKRIAATNANVLITGENGTGKSMLAKLIHQHSDKADAPFVSVNMAAIPENLFESELFGHSKGAFTDAKEARTGRFTLAQSGTLFLDEIGTLPLALQAKLLRVLESGEYEVLGSSTTLHSDARVISATNADLQAAIADGDFRQDLLYRLNTLVLTLPPLRQRSDELASLADHFIRIHCQRYQLPVKTLNSCALDKLSAYQWPGNMRELSHVLERSVIMSDADSLSAEHIVLQPHQDIDSSLPLMNLEEAEKRMISNAIAHFDGNVVAAGEFLGLSKSAMYRRLDKYQLGNQ